MVILYPRETTKSPILNRRIFDNNTNPMILGMSEIGYDSFSLGNHEFNYAMKVLDKIKNQAQANKMAVLCANLYKRWTKGI